MTKTTAELAEAVLRELGVIDSEETPDSVDVSYITSAYALKYAEMSSHGHERTYWSMLAIPDAVFLTLRDLMMNEVCGAFGDPITAEVKRQRETIIMQTLKKHMGREASNSRVPVEYM
jgi:hypothetical protein